MQSLSLDGPPGSVGRTLALRRQSGADPSMEHARSTPTPGPSPGHGYTSHKPYTRWLEHGGARPSQRERAAARAPGLSGHRRCKQALCVFKPPLIRSPAPAPSALRPKRSPALHRAAPRRDRRRDGVRPSPGCLPAPSAVRPKRSPALRSQDGPCTPHHTSPCFIPGTKWLLARVRQQHGPRSLPTRQNSHIPPPPAPKIFFCPPLVPLSQRTLWRRG